MIPRAHITAWRSQVPWPADEQVEQDLAISRALVVMFSQEGVAEQAIFRGGTALHKLFLGEGARYSEDIDLVQRDAGPIGELVGSIRRALDPWLGEPRWKQGQGRFTLYYRFESTFPPVATRRLKVEINTREHFAVLPIERHPFAVENPWFSGSASLPVYHFDELLGTKMRALYQRRKGRDLFDLAAALRTGRATSPRVVECFRRYLDHDGLTVTRAEFEANLAAKLETAAFRQDILPLLAADAAYEPDAAAELVRRELVSRLPGEPWQGLA